MPFKVTRDEELKVTRTQYWGCIEIDTIVGSHLHLLDLPEHIGISLVTFLPESQLNISTNDIRSLALRIGQKRPSDWPPGRAAIVAPSPLIYGISRMYMAYAEQVPTKIKIFSTETDAIAWLAADQEDIENDQVSVR